MIFTQWVVELEIDEKLSKFQNTKIIKIFEKRSKKLIQAYWVQI